MDVAALYCDYQGLISSIAYRYLHDLNGVEDAIQETIMRAWLHPESFRYGKRSTWIGQIVKNYAIDEYRRRQVRPVECVNTAELVGDMTDVDDHLALWEALDRLPAEQRQVVVSRYLEGMTSVEIARELHVPVATVKSRLRRGLQAARELITAR